MLAFIGALGDGAGHAAQNVTGAHSSPGGQYLPFLPDQKTHAWSTSSRNKWQMPMGSGDATSHLSADEETEAQRAGCPNRSTLQGLRFLLCHMDHCCKSPPHSAVLGSGFKSTYLPGAPAMCTVCPRQRGEHEETHSTILVRERGVWTRQDMRANEPFKSRCLGVAERAESSE